MRFVKKFIGTKAFYMSVIALLVPMVVQQGITQFVNLLDNVMVGRLGTEPMSGVAIEIGRASCRERVCRSV